ncbi:MAG: hypothetical protein MJ191_06555 [Clostridium sp.]|nr:hypothetical protein [Clostridium sp.]
MEILEVFIRKLCGKFNNDNQIKQEEELGKVIHPRARHINAVCNNKIRNLPKDFKGYFIIEESYYEIGERVNILPHLFLFELNNDNNVVLTSYELPEGIKKEEFRNDNADLIMDYRFLVKSEKFTPMIYKEMDGVFSGESISTFGPGVTFELKESTGNNKLIVSEILKKDGKITFGFEEPIVYDKIK